MQMLISLSRMLPVDRLHHDVSLYKWKQSGDSTLNVVFDALTVKQGMHSMSFNFWLKRSYSYKFMHVLIQRTTVH